MTFVPLWMLGAYLLGAIPTSYIVARVFGGVDLREFGSRNLGATNLYRALGWWAAVPTGVFDVAKGTVPVLLARGAFPEASAWPVVVGLAAIVGHVYSPFVRFKGGKGVATAAGVFLALAPLALVIALVVWAVVVKASGYVSLGSMVGAAAFAASIPLLYPGAPVSTVAAGFVTFVFIVFTHRANLGRLLAGTESRFGNRGEGRA